MKEINQFIAGFRNFRDEYFCCENSPFTELAKGQKPSTMVVACSDSRTDPSLLMQCGPGEIFVVRNIANIVPPYEPDPGLHGVSAAIEYAVKVLQVQNVIILGHSTCGGIRALLDGDMARDSEFVGNWLATMGGVRDEVLSRFDAAHPKACKACELAAILQSMENLLSFPWVAERVKTGRLHLHGWYFDMETGQLLGYQPKTQTFEPLTRSCAEVQQAPVLPVQESA